MRNIGRRRFVQGAALGGVLGFGASQGIIWLMSHRNRTVLEQVLTFAKSQNWVSHEVGLSYLAQNSADEANEYTLLRALTPAKSDPDVNIHEYLVKRIKSDFSNGELCEIDGWTLSLTECRVAALVTLLKIENQRSSVGKVEEKNQPNKPKNLEITNWGPTNGKAGQAFNKQPNGNSALWIKVSGLDRQGKYKVYFSDSKMKTTIHFEKELITADLTANEAALLLKEPGTHKVSLIDEATGRRFTIGQFKVK